MEYTTLRILLFIVLLFFLREILIPFIRRFFPAKSTPELTPEQQQKKNTESRIAWTIFGVIAIGFYVVFLFLAKQS